MYLHVSDMTSKTFSGQTISDLFPQPNQNKIDYVDLLQIATWRSLKHPTKLVYIIFKKELKKEILITDSSTASALHAALKIRKMFLLKALSFLLHVVDLQNACMTLKLFS